MSRYIVGALIMVCVLVLLCRNIPPTPTLYERLGGIYSIAAVVDDFSDALIRNQIVGKDSPNPQLREWSRDSLGRLPGLKWMRTLWVADLTGGPYRFIPSVTARRGKCPFSLERTHMNLQISPAEFDAVAAELAKSLDKFGVPVVEKDLVLSTFAAHKPDVTTGYAVANGLSIPVIKC